MTNEAQSAVVRREDEGGIAIITVDSPPVNALSAAVRQGLDRAIRSAVGDPAIEAMVIICAGRTFIAGGDISEFAKPMAKPELRELIATIEASPKPVVAAIHGTALGGGLELALGCTYRLATPSAKLGVPEVKLGILPGAGGTQRLPRLVGARLGLEMVTSGTPIGAAKALDAGLVDALVPEDDLRAAAVGFARTAVAEKRPLRRVRDLAVAGASAQLFADFRAANARKFRGFDAPEANIKCIEAAASEPFEAGLETELRLLKDLFGSAQAAAQQHLFFAERRAAKISGLDDKQKPLPITKVGVIGAGTMGGGIAMTFLSAGMPVTIVETAQAALDRGVGIIRKNYEGAAAKGRLNAEAVERNMSLLTPTLDLAQLADCDLVIEAVYEDMDVKKAIFARLDAIARPGAILATNTSFLNVDEIAAATSRPQAVLGLHFFSPANVMRLLEIVRGAKTDRAVLATAMALAKRIGKIAVVSGVCYGFIGNRMLAQRQREARKLILEGVTPWDVDRVVQAFGMPMGPFQMSDLVGLDLGWSPETSDRASITDRLCEAGRRGQKAGAGFYDYDAARKGSPSELVEGMIRELSAEQGVAPRSVTDEEILERCIYPMINEAAKILQEGVAYRASDIDVVWVNGYGWPPYRGGPTFYADLIGVRTVLDRLKFYQGRYGEDFAPAKLLERLAEEGRGFSDIQGR